MVIFANMWQNLTEEIRAEIENVPDDVILTPEPSYG